MTRLVIHADDVGMCHGANRAFVELSHFGTITSGSVMVPCPWFSEIAAIASGAIESGTTATGAAEFGATATGATASAASAGGGAATATRGGALDCGVHLTLNSEKEHYRWGGVSPSSQQRSSGLIDGHGYLWPDVASVRRHAHPEAVEQEWRAQIDRALAAGINVTHLDAHMGSALAPEWCDRYVAVGIDYGVPVLITESLAAYGPNRHVLDGDTDPQAVDEAVRAAADDARAAGMPVFDLVLETDFSRPAAQPPDYKGMLGAVADGAGANGDGADGAGANETDALVFCAFHPNAPGGAEVEVIEPDSFHVRTDEYELFGTLAWKNWLTEQPFKLTSMGDLA